MCKDLKDVKKKVEGMKNSPLKDKVLQDANSKLKGKSITK